MDETASCVELYHGSTDVSPGMSPFVHDPEAQARYGKRYGNYSFAVVTIAAGQEHIKRSAVNKKDNRVSN